MRSVSAGRVSRGGRRKATAPPGNDIIRKKTASRAVLASTLRIQDGNSAAEMAAPMAATNTASASHRKRRERESRKYFNLHLLRTNVVSNIFSGHGQLVGARDRLVGNCQ